MNDLISRQAAIEKLLKEISAINAVSSVEMKELRCGLRLAKNIIEDLPSVKSASHVVANVTLDEEKLKEICANAVQEIKSSVQQWIPVSERLPEDVQIGEEYPIVIFCTKEKTYTGFYECSDSRWWTADCESVVDGVIAWMPLPESYRGDEK